MVSLRTTIFGLIFVTTPVIRQAFAFQSAVKISSRHPELVKFYQATLHMSAAVTSPARILVSGQAGKKNELLFLPPQDGRGATENVVYFPGDVQDYASRMEQNSESRKWKKYSLEWTAECLQQRFPLANIIVVKPAVFEQDCYSCYKNFLVCDRYGVPTYSQEAWARGYEHLLALLNGLSDQVAEGISCGLTALPLVLVGFSKGCVVLNQLVFELARDHAKPSDTHLSAWSRVSAMFWLDGGHSGTKDVWVTDRSLLQVLSRVVRRVEVHTTPYQVRDPHRPWKKREKDAFVAGLSEAGQKELVDKLHYPRAARSFADHFKLLEDF